MEAVHLTVAMTGASGAVFGRELLRALEADQRVKRVHFVASENSLRVMAEELDAAGGPSSELMLDSTWAKAHRSAAGGKRGPAPTA